MIVKADTMKMVKITIATSSGQNKRLAIFARASIATHTNTRMGCLARSEKNRNGLRIIRASNASITGSQIWRDILAVRVNVFVVRNFWMIHFQFYFDQEHILHPKGKITITKLVLSLFQVPLQGLNLTGTLLRRVC